MAVRRSALERVGPFDEARELYGDEEEWQRRLKAGGGRIRYVAAAALDHRRAGDDARLRALCRAAYGRGQASRRFDVRKGTAPDAARTSCACSPAALAHGPRFRCANGPILTAHQLGRLRALLAERRVRRPAPAARRASTTSSRAPAARARPPRRAAARRRRARRPRRAAPARRRLARAAARAAAARRVLVVGVERTDVPNRMAHGPRRAAALAPRGRRRRRARRRAGKFENLDALLARHDLARVRLGAVVDDDVDLPRGFLDVFLACAEAAGLQLAQPAHRRHSHAAWAVTRRRRGADWRETTFVEIGPVTAFARAAVAELLPFPTGADGLGPGRALERRRAAARLADRRRRRHADRPHAAPGRRGLPARDAPRPRRGASSTAAPTCAATRPGRSRAPAVPARVKVARRRRVLPARRRPGARRLGAPPGARRARRRAPRCASSSCTGPIAAGGARRASATAWRDGRCAQPRTRSSTASTCATCATSRRRAGAPTRAGARGRRRPCALALRRLRREFPFDLVHAHYAVPAGRRRAARARAGAPLVVSDHGGDVLPHRAPAPAARAACGARFDAARLVLANSQGIARAVRDARRAAHARRAPRHRPARRGAPAADAAPTLVTVGHLVARKRHADVLRALWILRDRRPDLRYRDHRRRARARRCSRTSRASSALADRVEFTGRLPHEEALRCGREAVGVRACPASTRRSASPTSRRWRPACRRSAARGEPGPEEIAGARRRDAARAARRPRGARRRDRHAARRRLGPADRRGRAGDRRRARSPGRRAAARRSRPTRTRWTAARHDATRGRSCSSPTTSPPDRVGAFARAARARGRSSSRCSAGAATTRPARWPTRACPHRHVDPARRRCALAAEPALPRRDRRDGRARRAARGVARGARGARRRSCCGRRSGRTRARPRTRLAGAPLLALIYRDADAVVAYGPHVAAFAARARRAQRSTSRRRPSTARSGARPRPRRERPAGATFRRARRRPRRARQGRPGAARGLAAVRARTTRRRARARRGRPGSDHADRRPGCTSPAARAPRRCATSTPAPTSWSCRRSRTRETSASRGGWSSTKPCTSDFPSSPPTPSAPPPAASCATSATASSCPPATRPRSPARCARLRDDPALRARLGAAAAQDVAAPHARGVGRRASQPPCRRGREPGRGSLTCRPRRDSSTTSASRRPAPHDAPPPPDRHRTRPAARARRARARAGQRLRGHPRLHRRRAAAARPTRQKDYADALAHLPADVDEYSDCRDVIAARASAARAAAATAAAAAAAAAPAAARRAAARRRRRGAGDTGTAGPAADPLADATPQERAAVPEGRAGRRRAGQARRPPDHPGHARRRPRHRRLRPPDPAARDPRPAGARRPGRRRASGPDALSSVAAPA